LFLDEKVKIAFHAVDEFRGKSALNLSTAKRARQHPAGSSSVGAVVGK
jgi:hypothetical protein